eukprot:3835935-Rhodomonas_salina.5
MEPLCDVQCTAAWCIALRRCYGAATACPVLTARRWQGVKMAELRLRSMRGRGASAKQLEGGKQQEQEAAKSLAVAGVGARGGVVRAGGGEMVRVRSGRIGSAGAGVAAAAAGGGGVQSRELASLLHAWAAMEVTHGDVEGARKLLSRAVEADASQAWLWRVRALSSRSL